MSIRNKAFAALALTSLLGVAACGSTKESTENEAASTPAATTRAAPRGGGEIKEGLKIAFLPKQINNPYFTISDKGGEDAVTASRASSSASARRTRPPRRRCPTSTRSRRRSRTRS